MKKCTKCGKRKPKTEFTKNKNNLPDKLAKICKTCASEYYTEYREKKIKEKGKDNYLREIWEDRLRKSAEKENIPTTSVDMGKIEELTWKIIDYPDKAFPYSLSHIDFMKKYELSVEEYLFIREQVKNNKGNIL